MIFHPFRTSLHLVMNLQPPATETEDASAVIEKAMLERRATSMPQVFQSFLLFFAVPESECLLHACEVLLVGMLKALEVSVVVRDG